MIPRNAWRWRGAKCRLSAKPMSTKAWQRADPGGTYCLLPKKVMNSPAWADLGSRGRDVVLAILYRFMGFNNGRIAISIEEIGRFYGNQNHGANGRAVAKAIEYGFLICVSEADHHHGKARVYELTFYETGTEKNRIPPKNTYQSYQRPKVKKSQFGAAQSAGKGRVAAVESAADEKLSAALTAGQKFETSHVSVTDPAAETTALISCQLSPIVKSKSGMDESALCSLAELREWARLVVNHYGYGMQTKLAGDANISKPALSKFLRGRGLADMRRVNLQMACSRYIPFNQRADYS